jgi:succinate dehydrogenase / fumarate reductase membrane anchor subunit
MRTPLGRVRGLGSAKDGVGEWIAARVTAVALLFLSIAFLILLLALAGRPHAEVVAALSTPAAAMLVLATTLLTTVHMRLGMQVIIEDYVHAEMPKLILLVGNWLFAWATGLVAAFAVLKMAFSP